MLAFVKAYVCIRNHQRHAYAVIKNVALSENCVIELKEQCEETTDDVLYEETMVL